MRLPHQHQFETLLPIHAFLKVFGEITLHVPRSAVVTISQRGADAELIPKEFNEECGSPLHIIMTLAPMLVLSVGLIAAASPTSV